jgi:hypothetical protein
MKEIGDRIDIFLKTKGLNRREYCEKYEEDYSSFSHMTRGSRAINKKQIDKLVTSFPDIDLNYILKGETYKYEGNTVNEASADYYKMSNEELIKEAMKLLEMAKNK